MTRGNSSLKPTLRIGSRLIDRRSVLLVFVALLSTVFLSIGVRNSYADSDNISRTGKHVLTVYDDGVEKGILTEADTLREALDQAGVVVGEYDVAEPSLDSELVAATYDVNIYRARPVSVHDETTVKKIMTPYRAATQIAKQADITLNDEDTVELVSSDDVVGDGAIERLVVNRAVEFTFVFYGEKQRAYTQASTVGDMLTAKNIDLAENDMVKPGVETPITEGMTVRLWREGKQTVTRTEAIQYPVRQIKDANQLIDYKKIQTPGEDGQKLVTYEIVIENGQEVSKKVIKTVVVKQATEQVEVVGTKPILQPFTGGGSKAEWLTAAGIAREHWGAADAIVSQESGWNPNAINPSSGACGLAQALPCDKVPGNPLDPVDSLTWMNSYVYGRYGGWEEALAFKQLHGWY